MVQRFGPVTAEDVKFSYERLADPNMASPWAYQFEQLDHVEVFLAAKKVVELLELVCPRRRHIWIGEALVGEFHVLGGDRAEIVRPFDAVDRVKAIACGPLSSFSAPQGDHGAPSPKIAETIQRNVDAAHDDVVYAADHEGRVEALDVASMRMRSVSPSADQAKPGRIIAAAPSAPAAFRKLRRSVFHLIMSVSPVVGGSAQEGFPLLPARFEREMTAHHAVAGHGDRPAPRSGTDRARSRSACGTRSRTAG